MNITVNGEKQDARNGETLAALVKKHNPSNKRVAVLLNDELVHAHKLADHLLKENDRVEILTFAGGG